MNPRTFVVLVVLGVLAPAAGVFAESLKIYSAQKKGLILVEKVTKTDAEWKKELTPEQFEIARKQGTEPAFSGEYWKNHEKGMYTCRCCGTDLFDSETKFESGT